MKNKHLAAVAALTAASAISGSVQAQYQTDGLSARTVEALVKAYEIKDFEQVKKIKQLIIEQRIERNRLIEQQQKQLEGLSAPPSIDSKGKANKGGH